MNCVNGKILRINLSNRTHSVLEVPDRLFREYMGGRSLGAKLLYDMMPAGLDPKSPESFFFIMTGPTTGTIVPNSGKYVIVARSPQTGAFLDSYASGYLSVEIKYAGWDGLMIEGKSEKPCYVWIQDDKVEFRDAGHIWGQDTFRSEDMIREETNPRAGVCVIGEAGERLSPIAVVNSDHYRQAARGGTGTLFGYKNLKGIAVYGTKGIAPADIPSMYKKYFEIIEKVNNSLPAKTRKRFGTPFTMNLTNKANMLPTKNFQSSHAEEAVGVIDAEGCEAYTIGQRGCYGCMMACSKLTKGSNPYFSDEFVEGPEYETTSLLGANLAVFDVTGIVHFNRICDLLGLDTIATGVVLGLVMESFDRGYITEEQLGVKNPTFGNQEAASQLIHMMGHREGFGDIMAQGVKATAEAIGHNSMRFAMQVKNLEFPGYDPRAGWGASLAYAVTLRGACHRKAWPPALEVLKGVPPYTTENKGELIKNIMNENIIMHSILVCDFPAKFTPYQVDTEYADFLTYLTGETWTADDLNIGAERGETIARMFNYREGFTRDQDTLPDRVFDDPTPERMDPAERITREHLEFMKDEYYMHRGWDEEGVPKAETLEKYGMGDYVQDAVKLRASIDEMRDKMRSERAGLTSEPKEREYAPDHN